MKTSLSLLAVALVVALAACSGPGDSDEQLLASARTFIDKKDTAAATIQLKSLLQRNPNSADGRFLLGKLLLEQGDPVAALVELRKAQELGSPDEQVLPEMARAMLLTGEHAKVIGQFGQMQLKDPRAAADLVTSVAIAHAANQDTGRAMDLSARALQLQPMFTPALLLQAQLKVVDKDTGSALLLLDEVLKREPGNARAGVMKGEILALRGDSAGALAAFRQVLQAEPNAVQAHLGVIQLLTAQNQPDAARLQLAELKKVAPNHPDTLYLDAIELFRSGKLTEARDITARMLKGLPDNVRVLALAGAIEYRLRSYVQAEGHLAHALKNAPNHDGARQLLAQTYLRMGEPAKALDLLEPLIGSGKAPGTVLALAGEAYLLAGDSKRAAEAFKRAEQVAPEDPRVRTTLAISQLGKGEAAIPALEAAAAGDKGGRADLALVAARLQAQDVPGALKAIDGLATKMPTSPLPDVLRGRVLASRKDAAGATAAFEAALKKDPKHYPAVAGLAALDLAAGKPAEAKRRLEDLLQADPSSAQAHIALAELAARSGGTPAQITQALQAAAKANPTFARAHLLLIDHQLRQGDPKAALASAQAGAAALPANADLKDALGRTLIAAGDAQQAVSIYTQLAAQQARSAGVQIRLAEAHLAAKDATAARRALQRALELEPGSLTAKRALAGLDLQEGRADDAVKLAREMQRANPKDAAGFVLEGDVLASRDPVAAVGPYKTALGLQRTTENAVRLHRAHLRAKQQPEAERVAADWRRERPKDAAFLYYLGDTAMAAGQLAVAEGHYRGVLGLQPQNGLAMNNVAWLMAAQNKPGAVAMAEQAVALMPNQAAVIDTLASALAAEGQLPKAIETQKKAVALAPNDHGFRLTLARLYIKSGEKVQARAELEDLQRLGDKFAGQKVVDELLKSVR